VAPSSFGKRERERAKQAKAAAKRERQQSPQPAPPEDDAPTTAPRGAGSTEDLLREIEAVHQQFEAGTLSYEEFEATKADLLGQLPVD